MVARGGSANGAGFLWAEGNEHVLEFDNGAMVA